MGTGPGVSCLCHMPALLPSNRAGSQQQQQQPSCAPRQMRSLCYARPTRRRFVSCCGEHCVSPTKLRIISTWCHSERWTPTCDVVVEAWAGCIRYWNTHKPTNAMSVGDVMNEPLQIDQYSNDNDYDFVTIRITVSVLKKVCRYGPVRWPACSSIKLAYEWMKIVKMLSLKIVKTFRMQQK